ncbi:hypothetical protein GCM10027572_04070 [Flexivirga lutea]
MWPSGPTTTDPNAVLATCNATPPPTDDAPPVDDEPPPDDAPPVDGTPPPVDAARAPAADAEPPAEPPEPHAATVVVSTAAPRTAHICLVRIISALRVTVVC